MQQYTGGEDGFLLTVQAESDEDERDQGIGRTVVNGLQLGLIVVKTFFTEPTTCAADSDVEFVLNRDFTILSRRNVGRRNSAGVEARMVVCDSRVFVNSASATVFEVVGINTQEGQDQSNFGTAILLPTGINQVLFIAEGVVRINSSIFGVCGAGVTAQEIPADLPMGRLRFLIDTFSELPDETPLGGTRVAEINTPTTVLCALSGHKSKGVSLSLNLPINGERLFISIFGDPSSITPIRQRARRILGTDVDASGRTTGGDLNFSTEEGSALRVIGSRR